MAKWWLALASITADAQATCTSQKHHSSCMYSFRFLFLLMTFLQGVDTLIQALPYRHIVHVTTIKYLMLCSQP